MSSVDLLRQAIEAARGGRKEQARDLLLQVVDKDPHNEEAWMWLSGLVDMLEDRIIACENVLTINPENHKARQYLQTLYRERKAYRAAPQNDRSDLFEQAKIHLDHGDATAALELAHRH